ncbi:MAG: hypothetical protein WC444_05105 [Candidatus Paceibacterota bacterium]
MALTMVYRGIEFIREYVALYLKAAFMANTKGAVIFTDGTNKITFSREPHVSVAQEWVEREIPSVLIGSPSGEFGLRTFANDLLRNDDNTEGTGSAYKYTGGDIELTHEIVIRSKTAAERDRLVDTVCLLLSHPDARAFFGKQNIAVPKPPSIGGYREINEPTIDYPIYEGTLSFYTCGYWQDKEELGEKLLDIIVEVITYME